MVDGTKLECQILMRREMLVWNRGHGKHGRRGFRRAEKGSEWQVVLEGSAPALPKIRHIGGSGSCPTEETVGAP